MTTLLRSSALASLKRLRRSPLRQPILRLLVKVHNSSYHMISFFASHSGLHPKHKILNYHQFFLDNVKPADRVLDIGCGHGAVAYDLAQKVSYIVGIDISAKNIAQAKARYQQANLQFVPGDATTYVFSDRFDVIVLSNVLEHIEHRIAFLKQLSTLAPTLLIRVPLLTRDWISVYKKQQGFEYRLDHTHRIEYTEQIFRQEMMRAGLIIKHLHTAFGELYSKVTA